MTRQRQFIDITYSFFIALAISLVLIIIVEAVRDNSKLDEETADRIGFLMLFPLVVGAITGTVSILLSFIAWREWRLLILSFLEVMSLGAALTGLGSGLVYFVVALYMLTCTLFSLQWFGLRRRRYL